MNYALAIDERCLRDLRSPHIGDLSVLHTRGARLVIVGNHDVVLVHIHIHEHTRVVDVAHHVTDELSTTVVQTVGDKVKGSSQFSRSEVEAFTLLRGVRGKERCKLLALETVVTSDRQVTHSVDVFASQIINHVIEHL